MKKILFYLVLIMSTLNAEEATTKRYVTWEEISTLSEAVAKKLPANQWKGILAITRGGLAPALYLSHHMGIRRLEAINITSYTDEKKQTTLQFLNAPLLEDGGKDWLVVDELSDSGETIKKMREKYPKATYVVLFAKPKGISLVDHYAESVPQTCWLVFHWEKD